MTLELTMDEAQILIAVLTFAEGAAVNVNPGIREALQVLRPWRSALLRAYLEDCLLATGPTPLGSSEAQAEPSLKETL